MQIHILKKNLIFAYFCKWSVCMPREDEEDKYTTTLIFHSFEESALKKNPIHTQMSLQQLGKAIGMSNDS